MAPEPDFNMRVVSIDVPFGEVVGLIFNLVFAYVVVLATLALPVWVIYATASAIAD